MSKPLPILSHMPWHVKQSIVEFTDKSTRLNLRLFSKDFKNKAENARKEFQDVSLRVSISKDIAFIQLLIDEKFIHQFQVRDKVNRIVVRDRLPGVYEHTVVENVNFVDWVVDRAVVFFNHPCFAITDFRLRFSNYEAMESYKIKLDSSLNRFKAFFTSQTRQIAVKSFTMNFDGTQEDVMKILPYLKPGTLKFIAINSSKVYEGVMREILKNDVYETHDVDLDQVAETEQWKRASELSVEGYNVKVPIEKWSHFSYTNVEITDLTVEVAQRMFQTFDNSTHWKKASIRFKSDISEDLSQHFAALEQKRVTVNIRDSTIHFEKRI